MTQSRSPAETDGLIDATEDWFVNQGIPHFIEDFKASEDVWTRAVGFLTLVFFAELFLTFGDRVEGWYQFAAFLGGVAVIFAGIAIVNRLRGRSAFARPNDIETGELALFVLIPPILALLGGHRSAGEFFGVVLLNIAILVLTYVVVSWGIFSMARWGLIAMWNHLTQIVQLLGGILPLMLLFSAFLFLNAEIWQVVNDLPYVLFGVVLALLAAIGLSFLVGAMRGAISELRYFTDWDDVGRELADTPLEPCDTSSFVGQPRQVPLHRAAQANLTLRLVVGLAAQVGAVCMLVFLFYVAFGMLTVREDTILQWTTLENLSAVELLRFPLAGNDIVLTTLHLITGGFVAAFSGLQFAVSLVTDDDYQEEFVADSNNEVREALAVRAAYLRLLNEQAAASS